MPRRTPLRQTTPLTRSTRLRTAGRASARKSSLRAHVRSTVKDRAKGRCELCWSSGVSVDAHHAYGRGNVAGIPAWVCELPQLVLAICRECHRAIHDGNVELRDGGRWQAIHAVCEAYQLSIRPMTEMDDPVDVMRYLCRDFEALRGSWLLTSGK